MPGGTETSDFDFQLPAELIAQTPLASRDASRLMLVDRGTSSISHTVFGDLPRLIPRGDVLVLNRSRVVRARLLGTRRGTGAPAEILLLRPLDGSRFEALVSPGGKLRPGRVVDVGPGFAVEILEITDRRTRVVELHTDLPVSEALAAHGHVPLPPYITRQDTPEDADRYQTVYAREAGSVAAPTAGLHFTRALLEELRSGGVQITEILLHVGAGTFRPVETSDPAAHAMHEEHYEVPGETAALVGTARAQHHHIWAVGTTSVRALESAADDAGVPRAAAGETRMFIRPPYRFRAVDHLITNFHLPRSTLIMLVAAFAGYDLTMRAYSEAVARRYRFLSYGDAMAIL